MSVEVKSRSLIHALVAFFLALFATFFVLTLLVGAGGPTELVVSFLVAVAAGVYTFLRGS